MPAGRFLLLIACVSALAGRGSARSGEDPQAELALLFGEDLARVASTSQTRDDLELAGRMMKALPDLSGRQALKVLICRKAGELAGNDPGGYALASEAVKALLELAPQDKPQWNQLLLRAAKTRYVKAVGGERFLAGQEYLDLLIAAGDESAAAGNAQEALASYQQALALANNSSSPRRTELGHKIKAVNEQLAVETEALAMQDRLKKSPSDRSTREKLIRYYLLDRDDPAQAAKLLTRDVDEALRTYVPLVARPVGEVPEPACLELAGWLEKQAARADTPAGQLAGKRRAAVCYRRYLEMHSKNDVFRLKAKMALEKLGKDLPPPAPAAPPSGTKVVELPVHPEPGKNSQQVLTLELARDVSLKAVLVPAGKFLMGSPPGEEGRTPSDDPQHLVIISKPFYLGVCEVTRGQFATFLADRGYKTDAEKAGRDPKGDSGTWDKGPFDQTDDHPVMNVSWNDAMEFCQWLSRRTGKRVTLPSEAQWEYACRAGTATTFIWGNDPDDGKGWCNASDQTARQKVNVPPGGFGWSDGYVFTAPVGQFKPNAFGLYDMIGNVWEWCADWHDPEYYAKSPQRDPPGPSAGVFRVTRGGSWFNNPASCRSAARGHLAPDAHTSMAGFRIAIVAE